VQLDFGLLHSIGNGNQRAVAACIPGLSDSDSFSVKRAPPTAVDAVLLDTKIYSDWLQIRVAVSVRDEGFNTKTNRGSVYITAVGTSATKTASCQPSATEGTCVATITLPSSWLSETSVPVYYGLGSSLASQTLLAECTPVPTEAAAYEDNLMVNLPSQPHRSTDQFDVVIDAQATSDVESTKFTIFIEDTSSLEIVGTPTGLNGNVWSYQFVVRSDGFTAVLNRKPGAAAVTSQSQQVQHLVQAKIRVKPGATIGFAAVQLRVQELNAPTPINPGGQLIPEGGYVLGNALDQNFSLFAAGHVAIVEDNAVGLFVTPKDGLGTVVNTAPLTGAANEILIEGWSVYRFGTTLRRAAIATCSLTAGPIVGITVTPNVDAQGRCRVSMNENATVGYDALQVTAVTADATLV
jgi:hypothetical protein